MLVNTRWIQQYLDASCPVDDIIQAFMRAGLEIEEVHRLNEVLRPVRIGFVREKTPAPAGDGSWICRLDVGDREMVSASCPADVGVEIGWGVPVASQGFHLPPGRVIGAERGHGAICLDGEMGMVARSGGLTVFEDESLAGASIAEAMDIDDVLLDVSVLPNRPDCLGLLGIAREVAAILHCAVKWPSLRDIQLSPSDQQGLRIEIEEPQLCHRYIGGVIRGVRVAESPPWLKAFLLFTGARPINNIVDVTNFVLYEWGQPLHAFDKATIQGDAIIVRRMRKGESLKLLDGTEIKGRTDALIIADAQRPIALAGIMGGSETQTTDATIDVLLEAACFEPVGVRRTRRALNLSTESSYRFERGTDPNTMLTGAFRRAMTLIEGITGRCEEPAVDRSVTERSGAVLSLSEQMVGSYLGMEVDRQTIRSSLQRLGMECDEQLTVRAPTWRVDVNHPVVLVEDVARMVGYDRIPRRPGGARPSRGARCDLDHLRDAVRGFLAAQGFLECRTLPLTPADQPSFAPHAVAAIELRNPMKAEMASVRTSIIPSLVEVVETNARRGATRFRFFELDRIFCQADGEPREDWSVAAVAGGAARDGDWSGGGAHDFYQMKGLVENLLDLAGAAGKSFEHADVAGFAPGRCATVTAQDKVVGCVGQVAPELLRRMKLAAPVFACELRLDALVNAFTRIPRYQRISPYPAVSRDLAIVLDESVPFAEVESTVRRRAGAALGRGGANGTHLAALSCFDRYAGEHIGKGRKSLALHLLFRNPTRTLTADEVTEVVDDVISALRKDLGAELRS